jgi:hypothetical protein
MNLEDVNIYSESSTLSTKRELSMNSVSEDEEDYLDTCPIYHDIDSQSIYGFDVVQQPFRKSEENLWKDCKSKISNFLSII